MRAVEGGKFSRFEDSNKGRQIKEESSEREGKKIGVSSLDDSLPTKWISLKCLHSFLFSLNVEDSHIQHPILGVFSSHTVTLAFTSKMSIKDCYTSYILVVL